MNDEKNWQEELREKLAEFGITIEQLFTFPFAWEEIVYFLKAAIEVAEKLYPASGTGPSKLELVMEMWNYYDEKYGLINQLDELIDFRKMLGMVVGGVVEVWDSRAMRYLVEHVLIPQLVKLVFPNGRMKQFGMK